MTAKVFGTASWAGFFLVAAIALLLVLPPTPITITTTAPQATHQWANELDNFTSSATMAQRQELAEAMWQASALATPEDGEWVDQLGQLQRWVDSHTLSKHAAAASCYFALISNNVLGLRMLESWVTSGQVPAKAAILVRIDRMPECATISDYWTKQRSEQTPVIAIMFRLDSAGLLEKGAKGIPFPLTVFDTTKETWLLVKGVRCEERNRTQMTIRIWPTPVTTFPCP